MRGGEAAMAAQARSVGAVVVYYNPDPGLIQEQLVRLASAGVGAVVIIDNSAASNEVHVAHLAQRFPVFRYLLLGGNAGLARAQNLGITSLLDTQAFILLLDQDSLPSPGMLQALLEEATELGNAGVKLATIGPTPINRATGLPYQERVPRPVEYLSNGRTRRRGEIISSGSLIPVGAFAAVGLLDEELFIDGVDHEWCWRAGRLHGWVVGMSERTTLSHMLGEGDRSLLGIRVKVSTPFRTYYQVRNYFILARRNYVPLFWKVSNLVKYLVKFFYFSSRSGNGRDYFRNMCRGARDGLTYVGKPS
jgi:rhamnosyltransferase